MLYKWLVIVLVCFYSFINAPAKAQLTYQTIRIEYDSGWNYKNLTLIPIRFKVDGYPLFYFPTKLVSLRDAMQTGKLKFKEFYFEKDASVRLLTVENTSNNFVLLQNGEMITGGKQDRMLAESKIIYPNQKDQFVDVFCIEQSRWDKKPKPFKYAGDADDDLKRIMDQTNQQQFIWKEIDRRLYTNGQISKTAAYLDLHNNHEKEDTAYLNFFNRKMQTSDSMFAGFIAITDTTVISCEVFATTSLTTASYQSMLQGWVSSAVLNGKVPDMPYKKLKLFTDALFENEEKQKIFLQKHGKAFICEKKVFHLVARQ